MTPQQRYIINHPERRKESQRKHNKKYYATERLRIFNHYGNQCVGCGESDLNVLTIDHIDGGGTQHRKALGTKSIYHWLIQNNFPDGFRTLCYNCNCGRARHGIPLPNEKEIAS